MRVLLSLLFLAAACGEMGMESDFAGDAGAGSGCEATLELRPAEPVAPDTLVATAYVLGGHGVFTFAWTAEGPEGIVTPVMRNAAGSEVEVFAAVPGVYSLSVVVSYATASCSGRASVNVRDPGAAYSRIQLRYTPRPDQPAPPQDDPIPVVVWGGADMDLGERVLDPGTLVLGRLVGPEGGAPGYLRLMTPGRPTELFADAGGWYSGLVPSGTYDLLVVPQGPGMAPRMLPSQSATDLEAGYSLAAGDRLQGIVLAPDRMPVAHARVALASGALPAALAVTDEGGRFVAWVDAELGPLGLTVVPPQGSPLPTLAATIPGWDGADLEVVLPDWPRAELAGIATGSEGELLPQSRVTFVGETIADAGRIFVPGRPDLPASACYRASVNADATGAVRAALPLGLYEVYVETAPGAASGAAGFVAEMLDLRAGVTGTVLSFAPRASATGTLDIRGPEGQAVAGATVVAVAQGTRGMGAGWASTATTDEDGAAEVLMVTGMIYEVQVEPPREARLARGRLILGPAARGKQLFALGRSLGVKGVLRFPSGPGQAGVRVSAHCVACGPGQDAEVPLAETVTGPGGRFELLVPDPGHE